MFVKGKGQPLGTLTLFALVWEIRAGEPGSVSQGYESGPQDQSCSGGTPALIGQQQGLLVVWVASTLLAPTCKCPFPGSAPGPYL